MKHTIKDFTLELIDEPLQRHVAAWEQAMRALKNEDVKPVLNDIYSRLDAVTITSATKDPQTMVTTLQLVAEAIQKATNIINANEVVTLSSNHGVMVKAAIKAGWIVAPKMNTNEVDDMKAWLVTWIAERIAALYLEVTTIPKN